MTSTTVRIDRRDKERLDRLRDQWRQKTGRTATQQELLGYVLEHAATHLDQIINEAAWRPFTQDEIQKIEAEAIDLGHPTDLTSDIDETVYDWDRELGRQ